MRTVAGAEPAAEITGLADGHATQMCADTQHDKPLGLLDTVLVGLGISQCGNVDLVGLLDLALCPVTDEDGLATPLDDNVLALGDRGEIDLDLGHGQDIGGSGHVLEEFLNGRLGTSSGDSTKGSDHEVTEELVRGSGALGHVVAEVRDLCGLLGALNGLEYEGDVVPEAATEQAADVLRARTGRLAAAEDRTAARARVVRGAIVKTVERRGGRVGFTDV